MNNYPPKKFYSIMTGQKTSKQWWVVGKSQIESPSQISNMFACWFESMNLIHEIANLESNHGAKSQSFKF